MTSRYGEQKKTKNNLKTKKIEGATGKRCWPVVLGGAERVWFWALSLGVSKEQRLVEAWRCRELQRPAGDSDWTAAFDECCCAIGTNGGSGYRYLRRNSSTNFSLSLTISPPHNLSPSQSLLLVLTSFGCILHFLYALFRFLDTPNAPQTFF